uniref:Retrovirus-related Pol polyprotein from transposon TNT 1-94 n=1 Tax=Cajanus cajan TaxID=3821 RepID=A0A151TYF4_CAJCA|nr:Retrovirus-related Pol polyprotein from transposon TNT 1-94 [Cajanus cajan]
MEILLGFEVQNERNKVCLLKKALYGLKQSPRAWFGRFTKAMISLEYKQSQGDHTLFIKHSTTTQFEMKDLGRLKYFLGIEVRGFVITTHVLTELQIADIFTKELPQGRFQDLVGKLGMIDIHLPT